MTFKERANCLFPLKVFLIHSNLLTKELYEIVCPDYPEKEESLQFGMAIM